MYIIEKLRLRQYYSAELLRGNTFLKVYWRGRLALSAEFPLLREV